MKMISFAIYIVFTYEVFSESQPLSKLLEDTYMVKYFVQKFDVSCYNSYLVLFFPPENIYAKAEMFMYLENGYYTNDS